MSDPLKEAVEDLGRSFDEFKRTNDDRLAKLAKGEAVAEHEGKLAKLETAIKGFEETIAEIQKKANRTPRPDDSVDPEYTKGFRDFMRKGDASIIGTKAVNTGTDTDGGFAVPEELDRNLIELLRKDVPMRSVCKVITVGTADYKKLANLGGAASGWVGETDERPETGTPKLAQVSAFMGEIYANPAATQQSLDDAFFNVENWLSSEVASEFAEKENAAFTAGDGSKKPKGFLAYAKGPTGEGTRPFGTLQTIASGVVADFNGDSLLDLLYSVKRGYRQSGQWMLNSLTLAKIRKLKDANTGDYLWQPGLQGGQPSQILGYGFVENDDMPDIAAGSIPVSFGDWKRFYTVVDRIGTRILRDPYTNKPYVHFYTTKRVGGMVENSNAVKLLLLGTA